MDFVSATENITLKIGPAFITGAIVFAERPDLEAVVDQFAAIVEQLPRLRSTFRRFWGWHVRAPAPFDIGRHVACLDDPDITHPQQLEAVLERARRLRLPQDQDRPPWLLVMVNAARPATEPAGGLPALLFHLDHAIADGMRALEIFTRPPAEATGARRQDVRRMSMRFDELAVDDRIPPLPVACLSADLNALRTAREPGRDLTAQIIAAIDRTLDDHDLFDGTGVRRRKVALIRLTRRNVGAARLGNFNSIVERSSDSRQAMSRRGMLPSLAGHWNTGALQVLSSPLPAWLIKSLIGPWYTRYDALLTIIPGGREARSFAGAPIELVYGVAPVLADLPLIVVAVTYGDRIGLTLVPNAGFVGDTRRLRDRFEAALISGV
jgi:hypothetical protein